MRHEMPNLPAPQAHELAAVIDRLVAALQPHRMYVFGSQARGDAGLESDVDMLVVVQKAEQPSHRLAQTAYHAAAPHSLALDIVVISREEFEWRSRALASLPAIVLREGRLVYATP